MDSIQTIQTLSAPLSPAPIGGWQDFLEQGEGFLATAVGAHGKGRKAFSPEILYNLVAMAIEKFAMAALMRNGALPYNHTMADLVESLEETFPAQINEIKAGLLALDDYQDICDPEDFTITPPAMEEIPGMLKLAEDFHRLVAGSSVQ